MRTFILAGIFALSASTSLAQTGTAPEPAAPAAPAPETATPAPPAAAAPADPAATQAGTGQPANLCQELLAFVRENQPEAAAPADAPATAAAPDEPSKEADGASGTADAPAQPADDDAAAAGEETATAGENSSPASGEAVPPRAPSESGSAQDVSGQSGPAHESPEPNTEKAAQGNVDNAPQTSSLSAPVPVDATAEEDVSLSLASAEELAGANDIAACQDAARKLRLAGAPMPEPLLALTALDLQYQGQANEAQSPAAAPEAPAQQTQPQQ